jgi:hemerythrin
MKEVLMPLIEWNESLSVDIASIDKQHQKLVSMINELHQAMKNGKGKEIIGNIIEGLVSYAVIHFKTEEDYFDEHGYPEAAAHKEEHAGFVKKVSEFKELFTQGKLGLSVDVIYFLSDWLRDHIKGSDKRYGPFLKEKGLE